MRRLIHTALAAGFLLTLSAGAYAQADDPSADGANRYRQIDRAIRAERLRQQQRVTPPSSPAPSEARTPATDTRQAETPRPALPLPDAWKRDYRGDQLPTANPHGKCRYTREGWQCRGAQPQPDASPASQTEEPLAPPASETAEERPAVPCARNSLATNRDPACQSPAPVYLCRNTPNGTPYLLTRSQYEGGSLSSGLRRAEDYTLHSAGRVCKRYVSDTVLTPRGGYFHPGALRPNRDGEMPPQPATPPADQPSASPSAPPAPPRALP